MESLDPGDREMPERRRSSSAGSRCACSATTFICAPQPPSSEEAAAAWRPYIETCIEAFGPSRCMFESNFPPDKGQCSYQVIFNAFKRIAAPYSEAEKTALFSKTATEFYRLAPV